MAHFFAGLAIGLVAGPFVWTALRRWLTGDNV